MYVNGREVGDRVGSPQSAVWFGAAVGVWQVLTQATPLPNASQRSAQTAD